VSERQVGLADGRQVGITAVGAPASARWVLFCHPAPGCGGFDPDPLVTQKCDLGFISLDRPGYGASDPWLVPPQPSPQRWVLDVQAFLARSRTDAESIGHHAYRDLAVLGWREGCIFAAALASALADQVSSVVFVEPMTLRHAAKSLAERDVWDPARLMPGIRSGAAISMAGLRSRIERMLDRAREQGDAGLDADRAAVKQQVLDQSLESLRARTLIVTRNTTAMKRSAHRYAKLLPDARVAVTDAPVPIAAHWSRIIEHLDRSGR
jgi:pimeloyl-ACP methyl ester carboxylesterase